MDHFSDLMVNDLKLAKKKKKKEKKFLIVVKYGEYLYYGDSQPLLHFFHLSPSLTSTHSHENNPSPNSIQ